MQNKEKELVKRLINLEEASAYIGMGRTRTRELMDFIGATKKFGSRVLFDKEIIDKYITENEVFSIEE